MTTRHSLHNPRWKTGFEDEAEPESTDENSILCIRSDGVAVIVVVEADGSFERELSFSEVMAELHNRLSRNLKADLANWPVSVARFWH